MSATPSWARTDPSTYSTIECTIDCGWTTTCTWYGREPPPTRPRVGRHQAPRHHERFLVGERDGPSREDRGHRRQEPGATDERRDDDVGVDVARQGHEAVRPAEELRPRGRQEPRQLIERPGVEKRDGAGRVLPAQIGDALDVGSSRREPGHLELLGEARD